MVIRSLYDTGAAELPDQKPLLDDGRPCLDRGPHHAGGVAREADRHRRRIGLRQPLSLLCASAQRLLPFGGKADPAVLAPHIHALQEVAGRIYAGEFDGEMAWSDEAKPLWEDVYGGLTSAAPGMAGKVLGRGQPQALRLALVYALADGCHEIRRVHLEAALEVWRYCAESVRYLFGDRSGSSVADQIAAALRDGEMTRTEISQLFDRHKTKAEIDTALGLLKAMGRAHSEKVNEGHSHTEVWHEGPLPATKDA